MPVPYLACMLLTASFYHLPPRVLPSIQSVEGGAVGLQHANTNGSVDMGLMQINSLWIGPIAAVVRQDKETVERRLIQEPCFNIAAAGAIMRTYLDQEKGDLLRAVGDYNSHTPIINQKYRQKIIDASQALFGP